jgi:sialate O-acetylesterase
MVRNLVVSLISIAEGSSMTRSTKTSRRHLFEIQSRSALWIIALAIGSFFSGFSSLGNSAKADITLAKIFSDNMVLQRNSRIKIWGTATPNQTLEIRFLDQKIVTVADPNGNWSARLVTDHAGGPYELQVADESEGTRVKLSNLMVGEVWVCSGQSNMEWPMTAIQDSQREIEDAREWENLRLFTVTNDTSPVPLDEFTNVESWRVCNSENVKQFSAVAYFFGRELSRKMNGMPIGLIDATWGGTPAEAWISRPSLEAQASLNPLLKYWDERSGNHNQHRPAYLFNGMISPLKDFELRGAIWYQGESNNGRGVQYGTILPTLIKDWRTHFSDPEMPFYFVQIAPYRYGHLASSALAEVWEAQLKTAQTLPHTAMVVTTDLGNFTDIHPANKQDVGLRLGRIALHQLYTADCPEAKDFFSCSPFYQSHEITGNKIRIRFENVGEGLTSTNHAKLTEFTICGADGQFLPAEAEIIGSDQIVVWSEKVMNPVAVRFSWNDTPSANLFSSSGLPASPFRTDDFELDSANVNF